MEALKVEDPGYRNEIVNQIEKIETQRLLDDFIEKAIRNEVEGDQIFRAKEGFSIILSPKEGIEVRASEAYEILPSYNEKVAMVSTAGFEYPDHPFGIGEIGVTRDEQSGETIVFADGRNAMTNPDGSIDSDRAAVIQFFASEASKFDWKVEIDR